MTIADTGRVTWVHIGDLHITAQAGDNYRDFLAIIPSMNEHLAGQIDFGVLPGDNSDDEGGGRDTDAIVVAVAGFRR
jgi:hypothetical protein